MSLSFIKLAYLAEFAVAFNMAFGEFKHEDTAKALRTSFESLDHNCEGAASELISEMQEPKSDGLMSASWLGSCVVALDKFRSERTQSGAKYHPIHGFWRRVRLFSTNPQFAGAGKSKTAIFFDTLKNSPRGFLASLAYPNTSNWTFPPCGISIFLWSLLVALAISGVFFTDINSISSVDKFLGGFLVPYGVIASGITVAFLCPRPLAVLAGKIIGRFPPSPRGRYYPLIMVMLITIILAAITLIECGFIDVPINEGSISRGGVAWLFLFGFLVGANILPVMLFAGYLSLETSLSQWAAWLEIYSIKLADASIAKLAGESSANK